MSSRSTISKCNDTKRIWFFELLSFFVLFTYFNIFSQTLLTTFIDNQVLTEDEGSPYFIDTILAIPESCSIIIQKGCHIFFGTSSGIVVSGNLIVEGTPDQPVVFSSIYDSLFHENSIGAHDDSLWRGIVITENAAKVSMSNFELRQSQSGIQSLYKHLQISNGHFAGNGTNIIIDNEIMQVPESIPYNYPFAISFKDNGAIKGQVPMDTNRYEKGIPVILPDNTGHLGKIFHKFKGWNLNSDGKGYFFKPGERFSIKTANIVFYAQWDNYLLHKGVPIMIAGAGVITGGASGYYFKKWIDGRNKFRNELNPNSQKKLKNYGRKVSTYSIVSGSVSLLAIPSAVYLFIKYDRVPKDTGPFTLKPVAFNRFGVFHINFRSPF